MWSIHSSAAARTIREYNQMQDIGFYLDVLNLFLVSTISEVGKRILFRLKQFAADFSSLHEQVCGKSEGQADVATSRSSDLIAGLERLRCVLMFHARCTGRSIKHRLQVGVTQGGLKVSMKM